MGGDMNKMTIGKYQSQPMSFPFHKFLILLALLIVGAIFVIDTQIKLGVAVGALYIIPVLMVAPLESRKLSLCVAFACTVLVVIKLLFWPIDEAIPWMVFANRSISVFVVWTTTILGLYIFRTQRNLRAINSLLTVCAWTKQVKVDGRWVSFDKYLSEYMGFKITHGITEEAASKIMQDLKIEIKET